MSNCTWVFYLFSLNGWWFNTTLLSFFPEWAATQQVKKKPVSVRAAADFISRGLFILSCQSTSSVSYQSEFWMQNLRSSGNIVPSCMLLENICVKMLKCSHKLWLGGTPRPHGCQQFTAVTVQSNKQCHCHLKSLNCIYIIFSIKKKHSKSFYLRDHLHFLKEKKIGVK